MRLLVPALTLSLLAATSALALPANIEASLRKAKAADDPFVLQAVEEAAKAKYPNMVEQINDVLYGTPAQQKQPEQPKQTAAITPQKTPASEEKADVDWSGKVSGGLNVATGNTERQQFSAAFDIKRDSTDWRNMLKGKARIIHEDDTRENEDYRLGLQTDYKLSERDYVFGSVEYVNDVFSGFERRITETVGYGYYWLKNDRMTLKTQGSIGGRHSKLTDDNLPSSGERTQHDVILKPLVAYDWVINERIKFESEAQSTVGVENIISELNAGVSTNMMDNLALKFAVDVEHVSDTPADTKSTDTTTSLNLVYDWD